mmetsp:Transcript_65990/g.208534  ORF Transcript_65990/g.208534 Transcript_65990/m.208534 type:complete len:794 (+) Transcript_65990:1-2382(+)
MCYFGVLVLFCLGVVVAHQYQLRSLAVVDAGTTQPNDFAIFVEGLPGTATDEKQIAEWFNQNAVKGRNDVPVVKVVIGWESEVYRENMRTMKRLQAKMLVSMMLSNVRCLGPCVRLLGRCVSIEPVETIMKQLREVQEKIRSSAPDMAKFLSSSGVVVVVFRYQTDHRACLERWTSIPARLFYTDAEGVLGIGKGDPLPKFVHRKLKVHRAPNPSDINWEDLGVLRQTRLKKFLQTNGCVLILLIASFFAIYGLEKLKEAFKGRGFGWSMLPVLGISITNMLLTAACKHFGREEYHNTVAEQTASQSIKMAVALCLNTAGVIFFKNAQPKEWYKYLVDDVFALLAITAAIQPVTFLLDMKYSITGYFKRRNLTDDQLKAWNSVIQNQEKPKTADEAYAMKKQEAQVKMQVEKMKKAFQPSELETTRRYAIAVRTFICCLLFSPLMPLLSLVGIVGLAMQYWVDKYMLLRWFKRPAEPHPGEQAVLSLVFVRYTTAIFLPISVLIFMMPSWRENGEVVTWFLLMAGVAVLFCITPLSVARTLLCMRCLSCCRGGRSKVADTADDDTQDYYKAQRLWSCEMKYHKSQFLYKMIPDKKNPELLEPSDSYTATAVDDVKGSYGVAAASMASGTSENPAAAVHVRGHGHVDLASSMSSTASIDVPSRTSSYAGSAVAATAGGTNPPMGMTLQSVEDVSDKADTSGDDGGGATGGNPSPALVVVKAKSRPVWHFETSKGYTRFDDDCQAYIEKKYQEKLNGGQNRVNVFTNGFTVSLDFEKMTQKAGQHGKVRGIRRDG